MCRCCRCSPLSLSTTTSTATYLNQLIQSQLLRTEADRPWWATVLVNILTQVCWHGVRISPSRFVANYHRICQNKVRNPTLRVQCAFSLLMRHAIVS